ncbi:MAG: Ig-like domain-containing protein [Flavobacteriales bacterium]
MRYQQCLLLLVLFGVGLTACKKDKQNAPPSITIVSPGDASTLSVPDTLLVTVNVSDDQSVEHVTVSLLDANYIPVTAAVSVTPMSNPATITLALPVTSEQLESGTYKLLATATDGELSAKDIHTIQVSGVPLRLRMIYAVSTTSSNAFAVYRIDSLGQITLASNYDTDLGGADISSKAQRLFLAGSTTGPFLALDANYLSTSWQRPNMSAIGLPWFTSVDLCSDGQVYVGDGDGMLHGYQAVNGTGVFTAVMPDGFRTEETLVVNDLLLCTVRQFVTGEQRLALFQQSSGQQQGSQPLSIVPIRMFERDAQHALVFGNLNGLGRVQDRDILGGGSWEAYVWQSEITAVTQVAATTWLVALGNGDLQRFTYDNDGSLSIGSTPVLNDMSYDPASGAVFGGADGQVIAFDPSSGAIISNFAMNGTVRKVLPLRNR